MRPAMGGGPGIGFEQGWFDRTADDYGPARWVTNAALASYRVGIVERRRTT